MIIHIGTNDAPSSTSIEIHDNLFKLKPFVNDKLPQLKVWLWNPTLITGNGTATLTVSQLVNRLLTFIVDLTNNRNIKTDVLVEKVHVYMIQGLSY